MDHRNRRRRRDGFTLIEALVAAGIVGLGLTALLTAVMSGTQANAAGRRLTQAALLAREIREWTLKLPFSDLDPGDQGNPPGSDGTSPQVFVDDLDDLMGVTYDPPRDGQGYPVADMAGWSQTMTLTWREPTDLATPVSPGSTDIIHVQVDVACRGEPVLTTGWLVARR